MTDIQSSSVTVMVSNLDTAIKFYCETLGMELKNRFGDHWADIHGPGITIGLHPTDKNISRGDNIQIGLKVPDLNMAIAELEEKGIQFTINKDDKVQLATFKDPDRNVLYLVQPDW